MGPYMDYRAAAEYLGVTVAARVERGEITFIKWESRVLFAKSDLDLYMAARRIGASA